MCRTCITRYALSCKHRTFGLRLSRPRPHLPQWPIAALRSWRVWMRNQQLSAELLGSRGTTGEPCKKTNTQKLYESTASALGHELTSQETLPPADLCVIWTRLDKATRGETRGLSFYENCFKCKNGEECYSPTRVTPALPGNSVVL